MDPTPVTNHEARLAERPDARTSDRAPWGTRSMSESNADTEESAECPTCGRDDFNSDRGMKCHHKMAHGESIAGVEVECAWCGDTIRVLPENHRKSERHFCKDKDCRSEWTQTLTGEDSPRWEGGEQTFECSNCGADVERDPSGVTGEHVFCDRGCYTSWKSDQMQGPDHHNWKGGYTKNKNWPEIRQRALGADGHQCQGCGITEDEHRAEYGAGLSVHHIRPRMEFDDPHEADDVDNLVALCRSCHNEWEGIPLRPTAD